MPPSLPATVHRVVARGDDSSIAYSITGTSDGPTTWVFIHGWGCLRGDFDPIVRHLPHHHRTLTIDLPGHGESTSTGHDSTMQEFARDVAAVLGAETVEHAILVGHSLGGAVAVEVARLLPEVVDRIVGLDSFHYLTLYPAVDEATIRTMMSGFETDFPAAVRGLVVMGSTPDADPDFSEEIFEKMSRGPAEAVVPALEELLRWDMDRALHGLTTPVTTIATAPLLDAHAEERYGDRIEFVVEDLGGHHFLVEVPARTAELLLSAAGR